MKHSYDSTCSCTKCDRERQRRSRQGQDRPTAQVMLDWAGSRNRRRQRVSREYWDAYESGRPMSSDDY